MDDQLTFDRPTAMKQGADVALNRADADQLMPDEVRVVRARDEVLRQRARHVVLLVVERGVVRRREERHELL